MACKKIDSATTDEFLFDNTVSLYGVPTFLINDGGSNYMSAYLKLAMGSLECTHPSEQVVALNPMGKKKTRKTIYDKRTVPRKPFKFKENVLIEDNYPVSALAQLYIGPYHYSWLENQPTRSSHSSWRKEQENYTQQEAMTDTGNRISAFLCCTLMWMQSWSS
ncbi:hypothetical protein G6F42_013433 [Rhizopus arrhizus]|nr:hypothetical protein G6F42_013433 [Rhizopus arrhizus]